MHRLWLVLLSGACCSVDRPKVTGESQLSWMTQQAFPLLPEEEITMKFSLITTTLGRTHELERLLVSIDAQTCRDFELIVVDQNSHDLLDAILAPYRERFPILHIHSAKGASPAQYRHGSGQGRLHHLP